jgi:hypothetical protein
MAIAAFLRASPRRQAFPVFWAIEKAAKKCQALLEPEGWERILLSPCG